MTVKDLQAEIRKLTAQANNIIAEVRGRDRNDTFFERVVNKLHNNAGVTRKDGYIGLGFKGKRKSDLELQKQALESMVEKEWYSDKAIKQRSERADKAYNTFKRRYGDLTYDEWEDFTYMMNSLRNYISDFGYEDLGNAMAAAYTESTQKRRFYDHVKETGSLLKGKGMTPEDFIDELRDLMVEEGALDEW